MKRSDYEWSDEERSILKDNYNSISLLDIVKMLPKRGYGGVRHQVIKLGLHLSNNLRKYYINKQCFNDINYNSCYWAGFIAADGCVRGNRLSIGLKVSDKSHLDKLVKFMEYTNPTKLYKDRCSVSVNCTDICNDLETNFNVVPRKSKILKPPINITDHDMVACFIKGIIDGDGSVMKNSIVIYGTRDLLEWIKFYFDKWIPESNYKKAEVRTIKENFCYYKVGTRRKEFIYKKLKELKCDELERKWK